MSRLAPTLRTKAMPRYVPGPLPELVDRKLGPYRGMRDSLDATSTGPVVKGKAALLRNLYPRSAEKGGGLFGRDGVRLVDDLEAMGQEAVSFFTASGVLTRVVVAGGEIYTVDAADASCTKVVTAAEIVTAGGLLDDEAKVWAKEFNGRLVLSDGLNDPIAYLGGTGDSAIETGTCPPLYGPPTVKSAKLVGIKADGSGGPTRTMLWSEEYDWTLGFDVGGYNNAWDLTQTSQEPLIAIRGSEDGIWYWRERSTGMILGDIADEFQNTGTFEGVSTKVGTASPGSPIIVGRDAFWVDADGRPQMAQPGMGEPVEKFFDDFRETSEAVNRELLPVHAVSAFLPSEGLILLGAPVGADTAVGTYFVYRKGADGVDAAAVWTGWQAHASAVMRNADDVPALFHVTEDGLVYVHTVGARSDELAAGVFSAIVQELWSEYMFTDESVEKFFHRLDVVFRTDTELTISLRFRTPYGTSAPVVVQVGGIAASLWDVAFWDVDDWSSVSLELKRDLGAEQWGRWVQVLISCTSVNQRLGFLSGQIFGSAQSVAPGVP